MRNQWYGDKRDLMKWGTLIHLAGDDPAVRILQVLMMRPDAERDSSLTERKAHVVTPHSMPARVSDYFRRFRHVRDIVHLDTRIGVYDKPFPGKDQGTCQDRRTHYFAATCQWIGRFREKRRVVLVDPDTGIKQERRTWRHIEPKELHCLYDELNPGDMLILYQHALHRRNWVRMTLTQFAEAIGVRRGEVRVFQCRKPPCGVALFAATRN
jgi:hypothetical protein